MLALADLQLLQFCRTSPSLASPFRPCTNLLLPKSLRFQRQDRFADKAFGTVAALSFQGLLSASGLVMLCLMTFIEILHAY